MRLRGEGAKKLQDARKSEKTMRTKNLTIAFTILSVILLASRATLAVTILDNVDTNKKGPDLTLAYNDNDNDGYHDKGEAWETSIQSGWTKGKWASDNSCWMASASNMLQYEFPSRYNAETTYTELLDGKVTSPKTNPWNVSISANDGLGDSHMTFDDGGFADWVFSTYSVGFDRINASIDDIWDTNPTDWCWDMIHANHPVSLGIYDAFGHGHAITLWGIIQIISPTILITDSDDSIIGAQTYHYQYTNDNKWILTDSGSNWYVDYAVVVPEPGTMALLGLGGLMLFRRRR